MNTIDVIINYPPHLPDKPGRMVQTNLGTLGEEAEFYGLVMVNGRFYTIPTSYLTPVPPQQPPPQEKTNGPHPSKPAA